MATDFGTDFFADDDLAEDLRTVGGSDPLIVEQAIWRRLGTPRGTLISPIDPPDERDVDYGTLLEDLLSLGMLPGVGATSGVFAVQAFVAGEVNKEDEVDPTQTAVTFVTTPGPSVSGTLTITGATAVGPFSLVIGVGAFASTGSTVSLLRTGGQQ